MQRMLSQATRGAYGNLGLWDQSSRWSGACRHLDADEAVVLGAGLFAANLSTTFRLRKFGMTDGATFPLMFQVSSFPE